MPATRKPKQNLMTRLMNEVIAYGGLPVTRSFAYTHAHWALKDRLSGQKLISTAQLYAFGPNKPAIDAEPLTYEQWVEITGQDFLAAA